MTLLLRVQVTGIDDAIKAIEKIKVQDEARAFLKTVIIPYLQQDFARAFKTRGFRSWRPLAPSTIREKRRLGFSTAILQRTRHYRNTAISLRGQSLRQNVLEVTSPVPYAKYHEFGTRRIPKRALFEPVAERLQKRIRKLYRDYNRRRRRS